MTNPCGQNFPEQGDYLHKAMNRQSQSHSVVPGYGAVSDDERTLCEDNNGTYPRLAKLSNGSILAGFTRREGNLRILRISRSEDGGRSFSHFGEVSRGTGDIDNMFLLEIAPGRVLAAFRNHDVGPSEPTFFRITVCQSLDGGRHWTFLSQAAEKGAPYGLWEPFMRIGRRGEVQLMFSQEFEPHVQRTMRVLSYDLGRTWTKPVCVVGEEEGLRDGMVGIAETSDETRDETREQGAYALFMVFETTRYGTQSLEGAVSYDDGASWEHRQEVYVPPRGHNAGAPQIASFADGSMAVVFMTDEDSDVVDWVQHAAIKVIFSGPIRNGRPCWSKSNLVSPGSSFWPGIMALDEFTALATYDCRGPRVRTVQSYGLQNEWWHTEVNVARPVFMGGNS
jgi:hypothetical protein